MKHEQPSLTTQLPDPDAKCPSCGTALNAATATELPGGAPSPGDLTVCLQCAVILQFGEGLTQTIAPRELLLNLDPMTSNRLLAVQCMIEGFQRHAVAKGWRT